MNQRWLFIPSLILILGLLHAVTAQESKPLDPRKSTLTITAAAGGERVRFTAPNEVVQMRLEVYGLSGEKLFDNELKGGNVLDWLLQNGQAERLPVGSYLCLVTVKSLSGKLTQKLGSVVVEASGVSLQEATASQMTAQQAQAIGPIEEDAALTVLTEDDNRTPTVIAHNGEEGQIVRGRGALSFRLGDFYSGKDTEQMRLTEGGDLEVAGMVRASKGIIFPDGSIQFSASRKTFGAASLEPGQLGKGQKSGQEHFEIAAAGTGTQNFIAKWVETGGAGTLGDSILFDNGTNVGIGTTSPAKKLDVRGGQLALDNSRFLYSRRTNGQFQEAFGIDSNDDIVFNRNAIVPGVDGDAPKASSALIFGTGAARFMDVRNSLNQTLLRVQESTGNVGIGTTSPSTRLEVVHPGSQLRFGPTAADNGGYLISTAPNQAIITGGAKWDGTNWIARDTSASLTAHQFGAIEFYTNSGLAVGNPFSPAQRMVIEANGNVGIGTPSAAPGYKVDINTAGGGVRGFFNGSTHFVSETTGGTNAWARYYMRTPSQSWYMGTSQNYNGNQLYIVDEGTGDTRLSIQPGGGPIYHFGSMTQDRSSYGLPKAMVEVYRDGSIVRCYNAITGSSSGTCGFSAIFLQDTDQTHQRYVINFGFDVKDRFFSATAKSYDEFNGAYTYLSVVPKPYSSYPYGEVVVHAHESPTSLTRRSSFYLVVY